MFDEAIELLGRYYRLADNAQVEGFHRDLAMEVNDRLVLMNDVLRRVTAA